ncbi:Pomgnt1 [Symbiodinium natans]|uniref:Pomgnt1 protein n=1 Tax=Symbiodinium natans TaxID=878477 RepID=A0A812KU86_9DINO|nr:Pomgnt1 [Symbiodinium natans]
MLRRRHAAAHCGGTERAAGRGPPLLLGKGRLLLENRADANATDQTGKQLSLFSHAQAEPVAEALDWNASQDLPGFSNGGLQRDDGVAAADALHAQVLQQQAAPEWAASLETRPEDLAVLVVSSAGRQELLEGSLRSLSSVPGYRREQVLVFQDGPDARAQWVAQSLFKVAWVLHDRESIVDFDTRVTEHHREAISYALNKHFPRARTLLVVEEDMEAAPDMLYFFAQLEPILHKDPSLWCVSGRNELGLGPYAADLSGLLRTDVFAGSLAWMRVLKVKPQEPLTAWLVGNKAFRSAMHAGVMGATVLKDLSEMPFMEGSAIIRPWQKLPGYRVDFACPTEGISPECWRMVSNFFKLPEAVPPRGFYNGVLRLRWGAKAVLFIVADKASLIGAEEARGRAPPIPAKDFHLAPPPLLAIRQNVVAGNAQDVGRSCSLLCESTGKVCHAADLIFLNDCTSLRTFFSCGRCEISTGAVLPALRAPRERREGRKGSGSACMSNSDVLQHPPSCDVADADKQRLCVCRDPLSVASQELVAVDALLPKAGEVGSRDAIFGV